LPLAAEGAGAQADQSQEYPDAASAEASFGAPTAHCNAAFLKQAGVPVDFIRLADIGIRGNGHFLMLEKNNLEIAAVIADWLDRRVTRSETPAGEKTAR
jgi:hypothetical protein